MRRALPLSRSLEVPAIDWRNLCERMVKSQLVARGIEDQRVLEAFRAVPRHEFVPSDFQKLAFADRPVPLGPDQTISQPYVVAVMLEALALRGEERVLDIGTGSGYTSCLLSELADSVFSVDIDDQLVALADARAHKLGYTGIKFHVGDGKEGWAERAPFDAILVSAAAAEIPRALIEQLSPGGRLVVPVGVEDQELMCIRKGPEGLVTTELGPVAFVPLQDAPAKALLH